MDSQFWRRRWREGRTGFHEGEVNAALREHWPPPGLTAGAGVLVPLCGKALDLAWLARRGHPVVGVELSEIAVDAFFREQGWEAEQDASADGTWWRGGGVEILCGDFFALERSALPEVGGWYDRAALIALPPQMRRRYRERLAALLPAGAAGLLVTLDYPEGQREPPPFAVSDAEIESWSDSGFAVQHLARRDRLAQEPKFREQGVTRLEESVFALRCHERNWPP